MKVLVPYEIAQDDATGDYGLIHTNGMPGVVEGEVYACFHASLIAHDNVEHFDVEGIGTPLDEVKAHGGVWFTRIESGHTHPASHRSSERWLSYELARMLEIDGYEGTLVRVPNVKLDDEDVLDSFRKAARYAVEGYLEEYVTEYDEDDEALTWTDKLSHARNVYRALKLGYQETAARWGTCYNAADMFTAIVKAVTPVLAEYVDHGRGEDNNGLRFTLEYDSIELTARMWADEPEYDEDDEDDDGE